MLELKNINFIYDKELLSMYEETKAAAAGIHDINFTVYDNDFIGIIGHTGSGKSTLVQHLNGLLKADSGEILYNGTNIYAKGYKFSELRKEVGLVFQYPEYQLFKDTVIEDVAFGPFNKYKDKEKAILLAKDALKAVGIGERFYELSPFELSGGEKRRVAIAGVVAMGPKILVLDEPTAGLDPMGRDLILDNIKDMQKSLGIAVVLVSHSMEDVAAYCDRVCVIDDGRIKYDDTPKSVYAHYRELEKMGLMAPSVTYLPEKLVARGINLGISDVTSITTPDEAVFAIDNYLKGIDL